MKVMLCSLILFSFLSDVIFLLNNCVL